MLTTIKRDRSHRVIDTATGRYVGEFGQSLVPGVWYIRAFDASAPYAEQFASVRVKASPKEFAAVKRAALHFIELSISAQNR